MSIGVQIIFEKGSQIFTAEKSPDEMIVPLI